MGTCCPKAESPVPKPEIDDLPRPTKAEWPKKQPVKSKVTPQKEKTVIKGSKLKTPSTADLHVRLV